MGIVLNKVENIVEKGENAGYQPFLVFTVSNAFFLWAIKTQDLFGWDFER